MRLFSAWNLRLLFLLLILPIFSCYSYDQSPKFTFERRKEQLQSPQQLTLLFSHFKQPFSSSPSSSVSSLFRNRGGYRQPTNNPIQADKIFVLTAARENVPPSATSSTSSNKENEKRKKSLKKPSYTSTQALVGERSSSTWKTSLLLFTGSACLGMIFSYLFLINQEILLEYFKPFFAANLVPLPFNLPQEGFMEAFSLVFVSELGDKTFFLSALSAVKYGRLISLLSAISALSLMTIIGTILGQLFHRIPSSLSKGLPVDKYIAISAFTFYGLKTIYDAYQISDTNNSTGIEEEKAEAEAELMKSKLQSNEDELEELNDDEGFTSPPQGKGVQNNMKIKKKKNVPSSQIILTIFSLVFAAEIGDRSFLSTVALSATRNPLAVAVGAISAQSLTTIIAVIAGVILSKYLSEKVIGYLGGSLFLLFAITTGWKLL